MFVWHFDEFVKLLIKFKHSVHNLPSSQKAESSTSFTPTCTWDCVVATMFAVNNSLCCWHKYSIGI